jgi:hypothetical protein
VILLTTSSLLPRRYFMILITDAVYLSLVPWLLQDLPIF